MTTFELVTINCFGVIAPNTGRRLRTLGRELDALAVDVVCLQEVQSHRMRKLLTEACSRYPAHAFARLPYAPRGGLMIFSRHAELCSQFTRYDRRDGWFGLSAADRLLKKGVLTVELSLGGRRVIVLNTHLSANYRGDWTSDNTYTRAERSQLEQLARMVAALPAEALVIVAGDFNVPRDSALYRDFIAASGLHDPLASDRRPTYRPLPGLPAHFAQPIDFALVRAPALARLSICSDLCFQEPLPFVRGGQGFLSDHYGVWLRVAWEES